MSSNMQGVFTPVIIINLKNFRKDSVAWYQTINADRYGELAQISSRVKKVCSFEWGNSIIKLQSDHFIGTYHLNKTGIVQKTWNIVVYHFAWGAVYSSTFLPDDEGKIPQHILNGIKHNLGRVTSGYVRCVECKKEIAYTDSFGIYYDIRYCSREHEEKNKHIDMQRSR